MPALKTIFEKENLYSREDTFIFNYYMHEILWYIVDHQAYKLTRR